MITPSTIAEVETLMRKQAEGAEIVHYIVTPDLGTVVIAREKVIDLLKASGLENVETPEIRTSSALLRALREMVEDRRIEEVYNDAAETSYGLVRVQRSNDRYNRVATHIQEETITLHKNAKGTPDDPKVTYSSERARLLIEPLLQRYLVSYTARDITSKIILPVIRRSGSIKMRRQGGMYFVPASGESDLSALGRFIEALARETHETAHLTALQVAGNEQARADMRYHSHAALLDELADQRTALKDMLRESRAGKVKPATVAGYLTQVDDIAQRAALYRDLMALDLRDLAKAMDELRAAYMAVQSGLTVEQFDETLARVDEALDEARESGAQALPDDEWGVPLAPTLRDAAIQTAIETTTKKAKKGKTTKTAKTDDTESASATDDEDWSL